MAKLEDILPYFRDGKTIRRKALPVSSLMTIDQCIAQNFYECEKCDILADDWEIVEEPAKPKVFEGEIDGPGTSEFWKFFGSFILSKRYRITVEELP